MDIEKFKTYLKDPDPNVRKKAIIALAKSNYKHRLELLMHISKNDPSPAIREGVLKIIEQVRKELQDVPADIQIPPVPSVPAEDESGDPTERLRQEAAKQIDEAFRSGSEKDKMEVLEKLADEEVGFEEYPPAKLKDYILKETDMKIIDKAFVYIFKEGQQDVKTEIIRKIYDGQFKVNKEIIKTRLHDEMDHAMVAELILLMGKIGSDSDIVLVTHHLKHPDDRVRANAIKALRLIGNEFSHEYVIPILNDKDECDMVKSTAADYIFQNDQETALLLLEEMVEKAKDKTTVQTCITCLEGINHKSVAKMLQKSRERLATINSKNALEEAGQKLKNF